MLGFGKQVKIVNDEITPSHKGKIGTIINAEDTKVYGKPIRLRLMFGNIPKIVSYSIDELQIVA